MHRLLSVKPPACVLFVETTPIERRHHVFAPCDIVMTTYPPIVIHIPHGDPHRNDLG